MTDKDLFVLDSFALLAFFQDEPAAEIVQAFLERGSKDEIKLVMAVVNLGEVIYRTIREYSEERAAQVLGMIEAYSIDFVNVDKELALAAAQLKGTYSISYADCIAAALAEKLGATIVTGDHDFSVFEGKIGVEWLPQPQRP